MSEVKNIDVICTKCGLIDDSGLTPRTNSYLCDPHDWIEWKPEPIAAEDVVFNKFGQWDHSALAGVGEAYDEKGINDCPAFKDLQIHVIRVFSDEDQARLGGYPNSDSPADFRTWQPDAPDGDGWFPFRYSDDEDGAYVVYARTGREDV